MRCRLIIITMISCLFIPVTAFSQTFKVELSPVWWQYSESAGQISGFPVTPLHSKASGIGMQTSLLAAFDINKDWNIATSLEGIFPVNQTTEHWKLNPGVTQSNRLSISHLEYRLEVKRHILGVQTGLWSSYQWHQQTRQNFIINGFSQSQGRVRELIKTAWLGLSLESSSAQDFTIQIEGGLPIWVHTTNDSVPKAFTKRSGFRVGVHLSYIIPWGILNDTSKLTVSYRYRELGGELLSNKLVKWLWPKNHWQIVSVGLAMIW